MQRPKEEIRRRLLQVARREFMLNGFKGTSMRTIAQRAGVSLSNIYNYFQNKDQLFGEILAPAILALNGLIEDHNSETNLTLEIFTSTEYLREHTHRLTELIMQYREELNLLLFHSHGSNLAGFTEDFIERQTSCGLEYMRLMKERFPEVNIDVSDFFVHTMSSWRISTISELVMHDLPRRDLERFIGEYLEYVTAGWRQIMKVNQCI